MEVREESYFDRKPDEDVISRKTLLERLAGSETSGEERINDNAQERMSNSGEDTNTNVPQAQTMHEIQAMVATPDEERLVGE